jgi:hypothetical protein
MALYTCFVTSANGRGTTHIDSYEVRSINQTAELAEASSEAIGRVAEAWGVEPESLRVLGICAGNVKVLEWNDLED